MTGLVLLAIASITALPLLKGIRQERPWLFRSDSLLPDLFGVGWFAAVVIGLAEVSQALKQKILAAGMSGLQRPRGMATTPGHPSIPYATVQVPPQGAPLFPERPFCPACLRKEGNEHDNMDSVNRGRVGDPLACFVDE
jgi:hypothetical protein